jgi:uncharacterized protein YbaP (TraB family)
VKKFIYYILYIYFSITIAWAASDSTETSLWEVRSSKTKIYLLGSIHILKKDHYPLKDQIERAYREAEILVFEMNLDSTQSLSVQTMVMARGMLKNGATLKDKLPDTTYQKAVELCKELGLDIRYWQKFEPWYLSMMIMMMKLMQMGYDPAYGVDMHFYNKAKNDGKKIVGLESLDFQLSIFESMPAEKLVLQTISDLSVIENEFESIFDAWKNGDIENLGALTVEQLKAFPDLYHSLMKNRNENWMIRINQLLTEPHISMVIVGAGHLVGEDGLVEMLKRKRYEVIQR